MSVDISPALRSPLAWGANLNRTFAAHAVIVEEMVGAGEKLRRHVVRSGGHPMKDPLESLTGRIVFGVASTIVLYLAA